MANVRVQRPAATAVSKKRRRESAGPLERKVGHQLRQSETVTTTSGCANNPAFGFDAQRDDPNFVWLDLINDAV